MYPQDKIDYIKGMSDLQLAGILEEGTAHYPPDHPLHYAIPEAVRRLESRFLETMDSDAETSESQNEANDPHHSERG